MSKAMKLQRDLARRERAFLVPLSAYPEEIRRAVRQAYRQGVADELIGGRLFDEHYVAYPSFSLRLAYVAGGLDAVKS